MKKFLFLLTILFSSVSINYISAQHYYPLPNANANWNVNVQTCCWADCGGGSSNPYISDYHFSYFLQGDTTINSYQYKKIRKTGTVHTHCSFGNTVNLWSNINSFAGAYRQDTILKKVYYCAPGNSQECLLYDFSLQVGDTVKTPCLSPAFCTIIVGSIDSVLVGTHYHKRFNLLSTQYKLIEGIGSTAGLFEELCPFETIGTLLCFSQNDIPVYPDTATSCGIISDDITINVNEIKNQYASSLSPNPFSQSTRINFNHNYTDINLEVFNLQGQLVAQNHYKNSKEIVFERNGLREGMYFMKLTLDGKKVETRKVIISE